MSIVRLTIYMPKTLSELPGSMGSNCQMTIREVIYSMNCNNRTNFRVMESTIGWEALTLEFILSFTRILSYTMI